MKVRKVLPTKRNNKEKFKLEKMEIFDTCIRDP